MYSHVRPKRTNDVELHEIQVDRLSYSLLVGV